MVIAAATTNKRTRRSDLILSPQSVKPWCWLCMWNCRNGIEIAAKVVVILIYRSGDWWIWVSSKSYREVVIWSSGLVCWIGSESWWKSITWWNGLLNRSCDGGRWCLSSRKRWVRRGWLICVWAISDAGGMRRWSYREFCCYSNCRRRCEVESWCGWVLNGLRWKQAMGITGG